MIQTTIAQWQNNPNHKKGFNEYTGLDKVRLEEDGSYCLYTRVEEQMLNPFGNIHGGVIFTLCDNAAGSYMANLGRYSVTMHSDLSFYRPAHLGDLLTTRVDARKIGKTVSVLLVELRDQNGTRIADGTFQMFRVEKK